MNDFDDFESSFPAIDNTNDVSLSFCVQGTHHSSLHSTPQAHS